MHALEELATLWAGEGRWREALDAALQAVSLGLLEEHLSHCVVEAARAGGREADEKVREASEAIARLVRS